MSKSSKFYVVWKGRRTGIFTAWEETFAQVNGFAGAQYKGFKTRSEAKRALQAHYEDYVDTRFMRQPALARLQLAPAPLTSSYCADAACAGNPGVMEYRAVKTETGEILFERGPFPEGTNNIGEFLAIVETLQVLREANDASPIYSDSRNALAWVKAKRCKTQLQRNHRNEKLFERIERAEEWLHANAYPNKILKWRTKEWGEIPADYGRKTQS